MVVAAESPVLLVGESAELIDAVAACTEEDCSSSGLALLSAAARGCARGCLVSVVFVASVAFVSSCAGAWSPSFFDSVDREDCASASWVLFQVGSTAFPCLAANELLDLVVATHLVATVLGVTDVRAARSKCGYKKLSLPVAIVRYRGRRNASSGVVSQYQVVAKKGEGGPRGVICMTAL